MPDKTIKWIGSALKDLSHFPKDVKRKAGFQLRRIQQGHQPQDFKPMHSVGKGVEEIRINAADAYRIFYVAKFEDAVYVLHAFQKKTQKTSKQDVELGRRRYQELIEIRKTEVEK